MRTSFAQFELSTAASATEAERRVCVENMTHIPGFRMLYFFFVSSSFEISEIFASVRMYFFQKTKSAMKRPAMGMTAMVMRSPNFADDATPRE